MEGVFADEHHGSSLPLCPQLTWEEIWAAVADESGFLGVGGVDKGKACGGALRGGPCLFLAVMQFLYPQPQLLADHSAHVFISTLFVPVTLGLELAASVGL